MARQDSNIDPFNAGEPILPWNDSAQLHDEDGCVFDDQPYNAPSKRQDDYEAPASSADQAPKETSRGSKKRRESRRSSSTASSTASTSSSSSSKATVDTLKKQAEVAARARVASREGKGRRRVLPRVIVILIVFSVIGTGLDMVGSIIDNIFSSRSDSSSYDSSYDSSSDTSKEDEQAQQNAASSAADSYIGAIPTTEEYRALAKKWLESNMPYMTGYDVAGSGIDEEAWADWFLNSVSFTKADAYVYASYGDNNPAEASVTYDATCPDVYNVYDAFSSAAKDYLYEQGVPYYNDNPPALAEDQKAHLRELFAAALKNVKMNEGRFFILELTEDSDGTWKVDETTALKNYKSATSLSTYATYE